MFPHTRLLTMHTHYATLDLQLTLGTPPACRPTPESADFEAAYARGPVHTMAPPTLVDRYFAA
jgi:hypothetical protein